MTHAAEVALQTRWVTRSRRRCLLLRLLLCTGFAPTSSLLASDQPVPAPFRSAFEAQFPKSDATAAALELERLAAMLGVELAPKENTDAISVEATPAETDDPPQFDLTIHKERSRPSAEASAALRPILGDVSQFLDRELKSSEEQISLSSPRLERFFADHEDALTAIESVLLRDADIRWDMDVTKDGDGPLPNLGGHMQLQRLLVARFLLQARRGETNGALQTLEAAWQLNEVLASRPELICHLIVVAAAKLHLGALRKLDAPAYGWSDRLRSPKLLLGFLAAFENQVWSWPGVRDLTGNDGWFGRVLQEVSREFQDRDLCYWTPEKLRETWDRAVVRDQSTDEDLNLVGNIAAPNLLDSFARWRRFLIDAELTSLVLDAREDRAASRRRAWPAKLRGIGAGVCPNERWLYRPSGKGTATFAFEGRIVDDSSPFRLPLTFTAGVPVAPVRRVPKSNPQRN